MRDSHVSERFVGRNPETVSGVTEIEVYEERQLN